MTALNRVGASVVQAPAPRPRLLPLPPLEHGFREMGAQAAATALLQSPFRGKGVLPGPTQGAWFLSLPDLR